MKKASKTFRFSEETLDILETLCKETRMNQTELLEEMIRTYSPEHNATAHQVAKEIKEHIDAEYQHTLKKFIARTRSLDINQQLLLEILNSMAAGLNVNKFQPTDKMPSVIYTESRKHLSSKLAELKQKKDWKETK